MDGKHQNIALVGPEFSGSTLTMGKGPFRKLDGDIFLCKNGGWDAIGMVFGGSCMTMGYGSVISDVRGWPYIHAHGVYWSQKGPAFFCKTITPGIITPGIITPGIITPGIITPGIITR